MGNMLDYLRWRGDLTFEQDPFNDADAVLLSRLSYLQLDGIVGSGYDETVTLREAARLFSEDMEKVKNILWKGDDELLSLVGESERFGNCLVSCYVNVIEDDIQMQFAAMIVKLGDGLRYVGFRGTDNTLTGWQEDFNMFCTFPVPAHISALQYLEFAAEHFDGEFIVGGHSKGGNLAVFSSSFCKPELQQRIRRVYNMDGPGFDSSAMSASNFENIKDRILTLVPQTSIFGMMFEHEESYTVVKSDEKGFLQHDVYSWEIIRNGLNELSTTTTASMFIDRTFSDFVKSLTNEERKEFTEAVFNILKTTDDTTFSGIMENWFKDSAVIFKSIKKLDPETRNVLLGTLSALAHCARSNFADLSPINTTPLRFCGFKIPEKRKRAITLRKKQA